jgi:hypothetical protein
MRANSQSNVLIGSIDNADGYSAFVFHFARTASLGTSSKTGYVSHIPPLLGRSLDRHQQIALVSNPAAGTDAGIRAINSPL